MAIGNWPPVDNSSMPARRPGTLFPFEHAILATIARLQQEGGVPVYGSRLAHHLPNEPDPDRLIRSGWLYRALAQLAARGLLETWVDDPAASRPPRGIPRRYYRLTATGRAALMPDGRARDGRSDT